MDRQSLEQQKQAKRYLAISLILHGSLFLSMAIGSFFAPKPLLFVPTVQIDMVALPDQVKQQQAEPLDLTKPVKDVPPPPAPPETKKEAEAAPEPEKTAPDEMALKREREAEKRAKSALERMREQLKKDQKQEQDRKRLALEKRKADLKKFEEAYRAALRGNKQNTGTSSSGEMQATMNAYAGHITERLRANWALPAFLQDKGLRASVRIYIDGRGQLTRMQFTLSSGNNSFDSYVEGAVRKSSPFAPPPEEMASGLRGSGMEVLFPL
jgi:colicin import membrane protein